MTGQPESFHEMMEEISLLRRRIRELEHAETERLQAEAALKDSERTYRLLIENANDIIWNFDLSSMRFTFLSPAVERILGYTVEEAIRLTLAELYTPETFRRTTAAFRKLIAGEYARDRMVMEQEIYHADGAIAWMEMNAKVLRDDQRRAYAIAGSTRDIRERKQAEQALRESEEKHRFMLEQMNDVVWTSDLNLNLSYISASDQRLLGFSPEERKTHSISDMLTPESNKRAMEVLAEEMAREAAGNVDPHRSVIVELEYRHKDGSTRWMETAATRFVDEQGRLVGTHGVSRDVTDRKETEKRLLESEEKYRTILENMEDGYYEVDLSGTLTFFNPAHCRILGYPEEEMRGMNYKSYMDRHTARDALRAFNKVYVSGIPHESFQWQTVQKDGTRKFLEMSISLVVPLGRDPVGFRGVVRDVTERKIIEATEQAKARAEAASKAKSQFLANVSHEIRTPLNGILGMAELFSETEGDEERQRTVDTIAKEARSLLGIINDILDVSKIEAGKLSIEHIPFDLKKLLEDLVESFLVQATRKGLELLFCISPTVETCLVGDPGRLRQVLRNLVDNAIKFTHQGRVVIKVEPLPQQEEMAPLKFVVQDTGIGIPLEKQDVIFESFTQADGSTTRRFGGTGLGITISRQLAELMGGKMGLESEEGKGSTFWFTAAFQGQGEADSQAGKEVSLEKLKILVIDDNEITREKTVHWARSWGAETLEASGGREGLSMLRDFSDGDDAIHLVVADLNMAGMNGFDLARNIKGDETLRSIPIVIVASVGNPGDGKICRDIGVAGYLTRPIKEPELREIVETVLDSFGEQDIDGPVKLVTRHTSLEKKRKDVRILLVEDYPTNQEIAKRHLERADYHVDLAENGAQAVEAFKVRHYDLIFMDLEMPIMDGYDAVKAIRDIERDLALITGSGPDAPGHNRKVPIVAMTAHALSDYRNRCFEVGMDDFLPKPLTRLDLLSMAARWIGSGSSPRDAGRAHDQEGVRHPTGLTGPIDLEQALHEFEGDRELLREVMEGFTQNVARQVGLMADALGRGDTERVRKEAHAIKGGAAGLTAKPLSEKAFELENCARQGNLEGVAAVLVDLEREQERLERYIEENFLRGGI